MLASSEIRLILVVLGTALAMHYPMVVDQWLWRGVRDLLGIGTPWMAVYTGGIMVLAECTGRWCPAWSPKLYRPALWAIGVTLVSAVALWVARVPQWLGDYHGIDLQQFNYVTVEPAEPIGVLISSALIVAGLANGIKASITVQLETVVAGATAISALFLWTRLVSREWPLRFAMLMSCGFTVVFYGYPEKGTPKTLAFVCWYVYATTLLLREPSWRRVVASNLFLSLAAFGHGSAMCWLPAHAWYVWRTGGWKRAAAGVVIFLLPGAVAAILFATGMAIYGGSVWGNIAAPWQWFKQYCITNCGYDFFSWVHLQDIFHCLLALAPVATLAIPEAVYKSDTPIERWLRLGLAGWLFLNLTWFPVFGYVGDWDIFAGAPLVAALLVITVAGRTMPPEGFRRFALLWIAGSALHAWSWWRFFRLPL